MSTCTATAYKTSAFQRPVFRASDMRKAQKSSGFRANDTYEGTVKHIYFVAETKGSMSLMQLRLMEQAKIHCAREHFKAISGDQVVYDVVGSYQSLREKVMR